MVVSQKRGIIPHTIELFYKKQFFFTSFCVLHIDVLHIDSAMEYMQSCVSLFCANNVIIYQTFCSHTSQQNGVAETKH